MKQSKKKNKKASFKILIIEDAESILLAIHDYLLTSFDVYPASSAKLALEILQEKPKIDLIITDINLPNISGLELVQLARKINPKIKTILITSYEINNYIEYINKLKINQIISKHSYMSLHSISVTAKKVLTNDIFGIEKYFPNLKQSPHIKNKEEIKINENLIYSVTIRSSKDRIYWIDQIGNLMAQNYNIPIALTKLILDEISMNALVRAPRKSDGSYKYQREDIEKDYLIPDKKVSLDLKDYFTIQFAYSKPWLILSCIDPHGTLTKEEILYRLERQIILDKTSGLPVGLNDLHGRGIFLLREQLTQLIFNIKKKQKTEVLCFLNLERDLPYKDISIYEI